MSTGDSTLWTWRAGRLRDAFDAAFAAPLPPPRGDGRRLLLLRAGGEPCAVPMEDCASVQRTPVVTALPSRTPSFCGVTIVGGAILAVHDLAVRLGLAHSDRLAPWLLVSAGRQRVALLVDGVDGYAEVPRESVAGDAVVVTVDGVTRRLVALAAIIESIGHESRM